jgi:excisionase family DNA binding protein
MSITLAAMPTLKTLDEAAKVRIPVKGRGVVQVSRRTLQQWLQDGKLKGWRIEGDRRRFVDMDEVKKLLEPRPLPPKK